MSETIFQSLGEDGDVTRFIEEREKAAYESVDDFIERLQFPVDPEGLSVDTHFFRAYGQVVQADQSFSMSTLMSREDNGRTHILNRDLGLL